MPAFLEKIGEGIFVLRAGPKARMYGDPYTASGTIVSAGDGSCEVKGFTRRSDDVSDLTVFRDIQRCLRDAGFSKLRWDRQGQAGVRQARIG